MTDYLRLDDGTIKVINSTTTYAEDEWLALGDGLRARIASIDAEISLLAEEPLPADSTPAIEEALATWNYDHYTQPKERLEREKQELQERLDEWEAING